MFHKMRRKEKEIADHGEMVSILNKAEYVTIAMCAGDEPYLVSISHAYDGERNCIYFHCAKEGRKIEVLQTNPRVWGQALVDGGYMQGRCDHAFRTTQFSGRVAFVEDAEEKIRALRLMMMKLDKVPEVVAAQLTQESLALAMIGRIDIDFMSGKASPKA